jgi:hypothetical protein
VKNRLGIHIGMEYMMPLTKRQAISMLRSSLLWQEYNGPMVIFVDEPFYEFLYSNNLEELYQDIIAIDPSLTTYKQVSDRIKSNVPIEGVDIIDFYDIAIEGGEGKTFSIRAEMEQKDFVDLQVELLPEEYKKLIWQQLLHNPQTKSL